MELNKRGVSGVIVSVLMILLVIAAVGILWAVIQSFTEDSLGGVAGTADCLTLNLDIVSAVNTTVGGKLDVVVRRVAGDGDLSGVQIFVEDATGTITSGEGSGTIPKVGESKTLTITHVDIEADQTVKIAGLIGDNQCDVSDTATITST